MADNDPLWPEVLDWMYSHRISPQYFDRMDEHSSEVQLRRVSEVIDEDVETAEETLEYMSEVGLLEEFLLPRSGKSIFGLSERGFEVAHDRQLAKHRAEREIWRDERQNSINKGIAVLTLGLILIGAIDTTVRAGVGSGFSPNMLMILVMIGWFSTLAIVVILWKAELL